MLKSRDQILLEKRYILVREAEAQPAPQQTTPTNTPPNQQQSGTPNNKPLQINTFEDLGKLL